jgi:hypothetical protein
MPKLSPVTLPTIIHLRNLIYVTSVEGEVDLIARIITLQEAIQNRPRIFKSVRQNRGRRFKELM